MNIELSTTTERAPLEVLDLQVSARRASGKSLLFLRLLCQNDYYINRLVIPPLSWYDAHQLQLFLQKLTEAQYPETSLVDLQDAGLRLVGSVRRVAGQPTSGRSVRIAPLPASATQFTPFTVHAMDADIKTYARKLYHRLWESFLKG